MGGRRWLVMAASTAVVAGLVSCAGKNRHEVLSFFFDGVPQAGAIPAGKTAVAGGPSPEAAPVPTAAPERFFPHTPYKQSRCEGCHSAESGQLVQPIQEGLCLKCHVRLLEGKAFLHAPVAVGDCALCHHYHGSPYPNLLLTDPIKTCLKCHDLADLSAGPHHAQPGRACHECHDPHGEQNRFFVKGDVP